MAYLDNRQPPEQATPISYKTMRASTHKRSHSPSRTSSSTSPWRRRGQSRSQSWTPWSTDRGREPDRTAAAESSTIVLRGLALGTTEANVERALAAFAPRHVRVMPCDERRPAYCFVDFGSLSDARVFMEAFPGSSGGSGIHFALGGAELRLEYGRRRTPPGQGHSDWQCDSSVQSPAGRAASIFHSGAAQSTLRGARGATSATARDHCGLGSSVQTM
jgi:hypothetical protein